ncbi:MAG: acyl-CoA dehydrogenase FadE22 [Acidimicrobiia bacterium]
MSIALTDEHRALADVVRTFAADRGLTAAARAALEAADEGRPPFWDELAGLGWLGLHLPEEHGGQGYGLEELAVVVEQLGAAVAPGPFLPTVLAAAVILEAGTADDHARLLPGLADGSVTAAVGLSGTLTRTGDRISGDAGLVLGAGTADLLLLRVGDDLAVVDRAAATVATDPGLDPTRRVGTVAVDGPALAVLQGGLAVARRVGRTLAATEAAGGARTCTAMAVDYAKVREQFGRPIGSFQAVKHHCAEMLVATELAAAAAWDSARRAAADPVERDLAAAVAAAQALPAYRRCAEKSIQIHGGIGYTWEHDAHLHLRRAATLAAMFDVRDASADVTASVRAGVTCGPDVELPPEAEEHRAEARAFRARLDALPTAERRAALIDSGYFVPHWPRPWGRGADVVEQLVLEEELAGVEGPDLGIGSWVVLTLVQAGTNEQLARWIRPSLEGTERWCQLFSEPNAGSDAAAISTRATRVDGGWTVTGQKVWTSDAMTSTMGLATVRTDPDAPKHAGVTAMAIDMRASGVEVRPLREITGETLFNEVFFDDVFVPDDDVVGEVNQGWAVARATLGNERVSIGSNQSDLGLPDARELVALADRYAPGDAGAARDVGVLIAEGQAMAALNLRHVLRALVGGPPGPEGNVTKLLSAEHAQRVAGLGMELAGPAGIADGEPRLTRAYLFSRCLTIAGGTSEIVRNVIAERILGLPRDPLAR